MVDCFDLTSEQTVGVCYFIVDLPSLEQHSVWPEMGDIERQFELRTGIMVSDNAASR